MIRQSLPIILQSLRCRHVICFHSSVQRKGHTIEQGRVVLKMHFIQIIVSILKRFLHPFGGTLYRIVSHVRFRVTEIRIKINLVIRVCSHNKNSLIGIPYGQPSFFVRYCTSFADCSDAYDIFHFIIVEARNIYQSIASIGLHCSCRSGSRRVAEGQILSSWLVGLETHNHHIVRI